MANDVIKSSRFSKGLYARMATDTVSHISAGISPYKIHTQEQIIEAFRVFDEEGEGKIDVKYVGIIARALGRVPRKAELRCFIKEVRDSDSKESVKLEALLPALTDILMKDKWKPVSAAILREAFEFLNSSWQRGQMRGPMSSEYARELLTKHADKLDEEEIETFLSFAIQPDSWTIDYAKCCEKMAVPETVDILKDKMKFWAELKDETSYK